MIVLHTGIPGSGKTLSMVQELVKLFESWKSNPDAIRPVYTHGIPELKVACLPMPLKSVQTTKTGTMTEVPDWDLMPDGSLVVIDECQSMFPPRSSGSVMPDHVAWLNTHRHKGFDLWVTTQAPKIIDTNVRVLVGKHKHFRRLFGLNRAIIYEWEGCSDNLTGFKNAATTQWSFPSEIYKYYKSAEIHTKQKFKKPLWLFLIPFALVMLLVSIPWAYTTFNKVMAKPVDVAQKGPITGLAGLAAAGAGAQPGAARSDSYFLLGARCYAVDKFGEIVLEPKNCRDSL